MPTAAEAFELVRRTSERRDVEGFVALLSEDVVLEWPFARPGWPARVQGRERVRELLTGMAAAVKGRDSAFRDVVVHQSTDPDVAIVECVHDVTVVATGETTSSPVVAVIRVRDDKIVHYRDYIQATA